MAHSELESFVNKFKALLHSGTNATLSLRSEAGKASISLSVEIEPKETSRLNRPARNGPARQRRRECRTLARAAAASAASEATERDTGNASKAEKAFATAEEALANGSDKSSAVFVDPTDEIENISLRNEHQVSELCGIISVIPIRHVSPSNVAIETSIREKLEAKKVKVLEILIHRSSQGAFIRSDVQIEPFEGNALEATEFEFLNCKVLPFYGPRRK